MVKNCKYCGIEHDNWYKRPDGKFECRVKRSSVAKKHHSVHTEELKIYKKEWQQENSKHLSEYQKDFRKSETWASYKPVKNAKQNVINKVRYATDVAFRLERKLRRRLWEAIKFDAGSTYSNSIGCTQKELVVHLESKFHSNPNSGESMSWGNYGKEWEIDHIYPLFKSDLSDPEQYKQAANFKNLQPLWKSEHIEKTKRDLND